MHININLLHHSVETPEPAIAAATAVHCSLTFFFFLVVNIVSWCNVNQRISPKLFSHKDEVAVSSVIYVCLIIALQWSVMASYSISVDEFCCMSLWTYPAYVNELGGKGKLPLKISWTLAPFLFGSLLLGTVSSLVLLLDNVPTSPAHHGYSVNRGLFSLIFLICIISFPPSGHYSSVLIPDLFLSLSPQHMPVVEIGIICTISRLCSENVTVCVKALYLICLGESVNILFVPRDESCLFFSLFVVSLSKLAYKWKCLFCVWLFCFILSNPFFFFCITSGSTTDQHIISPPMASTSSLIGSTKGLGTPWAGLLVAP